RRALSVAYIQSPQSGFQNAWGLGHTQTKRTAQPFKSFAAAVSLLRQINVRQLIELKHDQMKKVLITRSDSITTQEVPRRRASILYAAVVSAALTISFGTAALAAPPNLNSNGNATGFVGFPFSYQIQANQTMTTWGASNLPGGLSVNTLTGLISGTPTTVETKSVVLTGTNTNGTGT